MDRSNARHRCMVAVALVLLASPVAGGGERRTTPPKSTRKPAAAPQAEAAPPRQETLVTAVTMAELRRRLTEAAREPSAVFDVPGTDWTLRVASVAVASSNGDVLISLTPEPFVGTIQIRGRPNLVGRNAWRADRLKVSVDTPLFAEQLASWIGQQIRASEPRSLDAIFGPSASFASDAPGTAPRVLAIAPEIRAGRLEPLSLTVEGSAIRLAAVAVDVGPSGSSAPAH